MSTKLTDIFPNGLTVEMRGDEVTHIEGEGMNTDLLYQALKQKYAPHTYQSKPKTVTAMRIEEGNLSEIEKVFGCKTGKGNSFTDGAFRFMTGRLFFNWGEWLVDLGHKFEILSDADFREEFNVSD